MSKPMSKELFRASSEFNAALSEAADVLSEDGRPVVFVGNDGNEQPAIDADVLHFLYEQELTETLTTTPEMTRADIAVQVDRWLAALYGCHERIAEIAEIRARRVAMVAEPFDAQVAMHRRRAEYLEGVLTQMARAFPYPQGSKSFPLAFGKIGTRAQSPKLVVTDKDRAIAWARENVPEAVEDVPTLRKDPLNAAWVSLGEPEVPGCTIEKPVEKDKPFVKVRTLK